MDIQAWAKPTLPRRWGWLRAARGGACASPTPPGWNDLLAAQEQHRVPQIIASALKQQVIILDELGFIPFSERGAQVMFQFCSALYNDPGGRPGAAPHDARRRVIRPGDQRPGARLRTRLGATLP
ncbi:MAG: hypothetical protein EOM24_08225 [Chloroflexia bacterium]|nr:hypothetical protein [Chloroflexia bacterium]